MLPGAPGKDREGHGRQGQGTRGHSVISPARNTGRDFMSSGMASNNIRGRNAQWHGMAGPGGKDRTGQDRSTGSMQPGLIFFIF